MSTIHWNAPADLLTLSIQIMCPAGKRGNEGLALWFGHQEDQSTIVVSHVIEVFGSGLQSSPLHLSLSFRALSSLIDLADSLDAYLVGQIHSHPRRYIDLSDLDREQGMQVPNYLSVVCPHYAQQPDTHLSDCGVHVFEKDRYRRLSNAEVGSRIRQISRRAIHLKHGVHHD